MLKQLLAALRRLVVRGDTRVFVVDVPGIGTGAAYADGDTFGNLIELRGAFNDDKRSGTIVSAVWHDHDNERINKDISVWASRITQTADNAAFAPSDADLQSARGVFQISAWSAWSSIAVGTEANIGLWVQSHSPSLWVQVITRGADNIAANKIPVLVLSIVPD